MTVISIGLKVLPDACYIAPAASKQLSSQPAAGYLLQHNSRELSLGFLCLSLNLEPDDTYEK